jgi:hypothetical protein
MRSLATHKRFPPGRCALPPAARYPLDVVIGFECLREILSIPQSERIRSPFFENQVLNAVRIEYSLGGIRPVRESHLLQSLMTTKG